MNKIIEIEGVAISPEHFIGGRLLKFDIGEGEWRAHFLHHCR